MSPKPTQKESEPKVPSDLRKSLSLNSNAMFAWKDLTPIARMDFISWIDSAKQLETRKHRITRACDMLVNGKRRPCCYSIVPTNLYKALATNPKAKAQLSKLDPVEKRLLLNWVSQAKDKEENKLRVEKACKLLADGKKYPK